MSQKELTMFEFIDGIRKLILKKVGEVLCYQSWSDDYKIESIKELKNTVKNWEVRYGMQAQPAELTMDEMKQLGFGRWSEDSPGMLLPIWLFPFLPDEVMIEAECIDGERKIYKKSEMGDDHRFGMLAYSVIPKAVSESFPKCTFDE